jgi:hypothetical protein
LTGFARFFAAPLVELGLRLFGRFGAVLFRQRLRARLNVRATDPSQSDSPSQNLLSLVSEIMANALAMSLTVRRGCSGAPARTAALRGATLPIRFFGRSNEYNNETSCTRDFQLSFKFIADHNCVKIGLFSTIKIMRTVF